ncbi:MAG: hypothetical protein JXR61_11080 [Prolixibacteraceae bacterium]|nr:hypothetical protein [Prolixibacteraceae bacterium]
MNNIFKKIFSTAPKKVPESAQQFLISKFPDAINVEWEFKDGFFETIFYLKEVEHIAKISDTKGIIEYKINLNPAELPVHVSSSDDIHGEIMNVIEIHREDELFYEIVVRDRKLNRMLLFLNSNGELLKWKKI